MTVWPAMPVYVIPNKEPVVVRNDDSMAIESPYSPHLASIILMRGIFSSIPYSQDMARNELNRQFLAIYYDCKSVRSTMQIESRMSDEAVLVELGERLARRRIDLGLTQAQAAEEAGVGKRTVERVEAGNDTQMATLIRLLRVLDLADQLDRLVPEPGPRPMELLRLKGKERKRASSRRAGRTEDDWQWGDRQ